MIFLIMHCSVTFTKSFAGDMRKVNSAKKSSLKKDDLNDVVWSSEHVSCLDVGPQ